MSEAVAAIPHVAQYGTLPRVSLEQREAWRPQRWQHVGAVSALVLVVVAVVAVSQSADAPGWIMASDRFESTALPALVATDTPRIIDVNWDVSAGAGQARITVPPGSSSCSAVLALSVGTALTKEAYDTIAQAIVSQSNEKARYVVVVLDPVPGLPVKLEPSFYTKSVKWAQGNINEWIGNECNNSIRHWVLGGHSAGGAAAHKAMVKDSTLGHAIFSLDPYDFTEPRDKCAVPAVYWGFGETTCGVDATKAARAFYKATEYSDGGSQHRMLYMVDGQLACPASGTRALKKDQKPTCAFGHCSFLTYGACTACPLSCCYDKENPCTTNPCCTINPLPGSCKTLPPPAFYGQIAQSFAALVASLNTTKWDRPNPPQGVSVFMDEDTPPS